MSHLQRCTLENDNHDNQSNTTIAPVGINRRKDLPDLLTRPSDVLVANKPDIEFRTAEIVLRAAIQTLVCSNTGPKAVIKIDLEMEINKIDPVRRT